MYDYDELIIEQKSEQQRLLKYISLNSVKSCLYFQFSTREVKSTLRMHVRRRCVFTVKKNQETVT